MSDQFNDAEGFSDLLTICIPTFNRGLVICEALADLIPKVEPFKLPIVVVDNCSTDYTRCIVEAFIKLYPRLRYFCQEENKGFDINFETSLKLSRTQYTWVLGDYARIEAENLPQLLSSLNEKRPTIYVAGAQKRADNVAPKCYTSANALLMDLGWHMTMLSGVIFSRQVIEHANFEKYRNSHFLHFGVVFEHVGTQDFSAVWENLTLISKGSSLPRGCYWNPSRVMEIFGDAWTRVVLSLPDSYTRSAKLYCIRSHGEKTSLFTLKHLLRQRATGGLTLEIYNRYKHNIKFFAPRRQVLIWLCCLWPNCLNKQYRRYSKRGRV